MDNNYEEAIRILKKNKQEHIIPIIDKLTENRKDAIIDQILNINFSELDDLYKETKKPREIENIEPVKAINPDNLSSNQICEYMKTGKEAIKKKELAVAIMAGGQGTRLRT